MRIWLPDDSLSKHIFGWKGYWAKELKRRAKKRQAQKASRKANRNK